MPAAAYGSSTATAVGTTVTTVVAPHPSGLAAGELMVACAWNNNGTGTHSATGWTVHNNATGTSAMSKVADAADVSAGSTTFNRLTNQTNGGGVVLVRITGAGTIAAATVGANTSAIGTTIVLPTVTATDGDTLLVQLVSKGAAGAGGWTPPGTATERFDIAATGGASQQAAGGDEVVAAGATGTRTWSSVAGTSRGAIFAISPVGSSAAFFGLL